MLKLKIKNTYSFTEQSELFLETGNVTVKIDVEEPEITFHLVYFLTKRN